MASKTEYLDLVKPDGTDNIDIQVINDNMDAIDGELKNAYYAKVKSVTVNGNVIKITLLNDTTITGTIANATSTQSGLLSSSDKSKLDTVAVNAKNVSVSSAITSGTKIGTITIDGTTTTFYYKDTVYNVATSSANGLMSKSDKAKLDTITKNADSVSFSRSLTSGTKIGTLTINGTSTVLYSTNNTTYSLATSSSNGLMSTSQFTKLGNIGAVKEWSGSLNVSAYSWSNTGSLYLDKGVWLVTATGFFDIEQYGIHCVGISKSKIESTQNPLVMNQALAGGVKTSLQKTRIVSFDNGGNIYFGAYADGSAVTVNYQVQAVRLS